MGGKFSHFDRRGAVKMVAVSAKPVTERRARAECLVGMSRTTLQLLVDSELPKGDGLAVARVAAISAAKKTSEWIPLCHPLRLTGVEVDFEFAAESVRVEVTVHCLDRTGAEMEALCAAAAGGLTLYDMCKAVDKGIVVGPVRLLEKSGGQSGHFRRS